MARKIKSKKTDHPSEAQSVVFGSRYGCAGVGVDAQPVILQSRVKTLADMTKAEKAAIEARYHAKIKT